MFTQGSILVSFLWLVEQLPTPPHPSNASVGGRSAIPTSSLSALDCHDHSAPLYGLCFAQLPGASGSCGAADAALLRQQGRFSHSAPGKGALRNCQRGCPH